MMCVSSILDRHQLLQVKKNGKVDPFILTSSACREVLPGGYAQTGSNSQHTYFTGQEGQPCYSRSLGILSPTLLIGGGSLEASVKKQPVRGTMENRPNNVGKNREI